MSNDISIVFKASDQLSHSVRQMRSNVGSLSRDVSDYRKIQSLAFDKKIEVKIETMKAKQELKELEKAVKNNQAGAVEAFKDKAKHVEMLSEELKRLTKVANDASKAERQLQEDISKTSNKHATRGATALSSLARAGLGSMIGSSVQNAMLSNVTAMYGTTTGNMVSNITGSTITGAALGSIAGPIGAAVGAAVGGLTGAINGLTENKQREDDYFREEVKSIFSNIKSEFNNSLSNGIDRSSIASQNIMGLATLLGSQAKGNQMFENIRRFGLETPYQADRMLDSAKQMLAYGISENNVMSDIKMIGEVAMGNQAKFDSLSYVYAQTQSAGRLNGQDLRQYTEAGFNPLKVLAEESGTSLEKMRDRMSEGLVTAEDVTRAFKIATTEGGQFYGAMAKQMETYSGKLSMLTDLKNEIDWAMGDGYTEERQKGMEKEIEMLSGKAGEQMKEAYSLIGQFQADLENKHQEAIINAITKAQNTDEYKKAFNENNGAEMGRIIAEAKAKAETEYKNSEGYKLQLEADLALVKSIQEDAVLNGEYINFGKKMGDAFSLGYASVVSKVLYTGEYSESDKEAALDKRGRFTYNAYQNAIERANKSIKNGGYSTQRPNGYATGLGRVPYDGFYMLHEGEKVETAVNAVKSDKNLVVNNYFDIKNTGPNPYEITKTIVAEITKASEVYAGG